MRTLLTQTLSHDDFMAMKRFPALDGVRALAASMVIFFHFAGPKWHFLSGWAGVYIFFVLSGFLITTLLLREHARNDRISLRNFYIRRVFRILPPYVAILGGVVILFQLRGEYQSRELGRVLPYFLSFFNEYAPVAYPDGPDTLFGASWTLGIEEKFYLVWPVLLVVVGAGVARRRLLLAVGALVATLALVPVTSHGWVLNFRQVNLYPSTIHYVVLLVGVLLAVLMHNRTSFRIVRPLTNPVVALVVLAIFIAVHTSMDDRWTATRYNTLVLAGYAVVVALLLATMTARGPIQRLLSSPPMRFVGERSYALYLLQGPVHYLVILAFPIFATNRSVSGVAVLLACLMGADLIHRWVEAPMIDVGKRIVRRVDARAAGARAEPEQVGPATSRTDRAAPRAVPASGLSPAGVLSDR